MPNSRVELADFRSSVLQELTGGFVGEVKVARAAEWEIVHAMPNGEGLFASVGPVEMVVFDDQAQLEFYSWLSAAKGLAPWAENYSWPEQQLKESLSLFGTITLSPLPLLKNSFKFGPDGFFLAPDGRAVPGEFAVPFLATVSRAQGADEDRRCVECNEHWWALVTLRLGLSLATSRARGDSYWREFIRTNSGPFRAVDQALRESGWIRAGRGDVELAKLQYWFRHELRGDLSVVPLPDQPKFQLAFRPSSAYQRMWVTLAATAGILELPFEVPGLFQCGYHRCGRWFFKDRTAVRGDNRFCSVRCGKSFHAAAATRRRRAAAKERDSKNDQG